LTQLGQAMQGNDGALPSHSPLSGMRVETDKVSGQQHLKLPLPKKETIEKIFDVLNQLIQKR
jgi:hypothetical protein